ncbi:MAG TPA: GntR family transcriptional regulator [Pseudonocardiaceae bacterium]|jgi:DNA-binding GntR family transcriptional regulator|nr:GntR family transcriptional regulator [Pseudonocardiaceae bacterium]
MTDEPAARRAYVATKDLILSGRLPAGSLLSEGEIAGRLSLSRTPVREAFLRLETEDLLHLIPKRGAVVVPVPATEAADVLDVRLALETAAVRRLRGRDDLTAVLAGLDELADRQAGFAADRLVAEFAEVDEEFHRAIVHAAGNAVADKFYATLADRQRRMTIGAVGPHPDRLAAIVAEHRTLRDLVADRDVPGFAAFLERHLAVTHNVFHAR